jgi:hypothetical protein
MNPTTNNATWVICPLTFDVDTLPAAFAAVVSGGIMSGASAELPSCFFTVNSSVNLMQPPFIYGPAARYALAMEVNRLSTGDPIWLAGVGVNALEVLAALPGPDLWAASMFCKLPPGYGISQLLITNNF